MEEEEETVEEKEEVTREFGLHLRRYHHRRPQRAPYPTTNTPWERGEPGVSGEEGRDHSCQLCSLN